MKKVSKLDIKVGDKWQNARITAGYTQEEVAEKLDCSNRHIGQLETNRTIGSIDLAIELCNLYGVTLNEIYGDYLKFDFSEIKQNFPGIVGYHSLDEEYQSIVNNNIQYLNNLQKLKK